MLELDRQYSADHGKITGIDEAGRGPLAGPLVVAAVTVRSGFTLRGLDDSKKLTDKLRRVLYPQILANVTDYSIIICEVEEIDTLNILGCTMKGMVRAYEDLGDRGYLLIDGNVLPEVWQDSDSESIIKGDHKVSAIAAASILAKVCRDDIMTGLDKIYPHYGFARNKGYGTREHLAAIMEHGITGVHRRSYRPVSQYEINLGKY
jgi:ribonuclease HII